MTSLFYSDKDPEEIITLSVNFGDVLDAGETISTAAWLVVRENSTENTAGMLVGSPDTTAAPIVRQKVQGGNDGGTYLHRCKITTSAGRTLVGGVYQAVRYGA